MKQLKLLLTAAALCSVTTAHAQGTSTTAVPNTEIEEVRGETSEFSGADAEGGSGFRLLGRNWNPSAFNVSSLETDHVPNGGRLNTYSYLTFGTPVADNLKFKLRLPFIYSSAGTDRMGGDKQNKDQLMMQDIIVELSSSNFVLLPFDTGIYWEGRLYLPNSQFSRQADQIAHFRNDIILEKLFTRIWGLEYQGQVGYYQQSRRTYNISFQDENGFDVTTLTNTKRWDLNQWMTLWAKVVPSFSLGAEIGQEQVGYNQSPAEGKFKSDARSYKTGPALRYQAPGGSRFILTYEDKVDRDVNESELGQFRAKNTQIALLSWISF